jgi:hypothetical protein
MTARNVPWCTTRIVAKWKGTRYVSTKTRSRLKIKNPGYSQAEGRKELFDRWGGKMSPRAFCAQAVDGLLPREVHT